MLERVIYFVQNLFSNVIIRLVAFGLVVMVVYYCGVMHGRSASTHRRPNGYAKQNIENHENPIMKTISSIFHTKKKIKPRAFVADEAKTTVDSNGTRHSSMHYTFVDDGLTFSFIEAQRLADWVRLNSGAYRDAKVAFHIKVKNTTAEEKYFSADDFKLTSPGSDEFITRIDFRGTAVEHNVLPKLSRGLYLQPDETVDGWVTYYIADFIENKSLILNYNGVNTYKELALNNTLSKFRSKTT